MTSEDLARIERAVGVTLPGDLRDFYGESLYFARLSGAEFDWEGRLEGVLRWRTPPSADRTPTQDITRGVAELEPGGSEGVRPHTHGQAESYYILSGRGTLTIEDDEHPLRPGTAVFVPGGARHAVRNTGAEVLRHLYVFPVASFGEVHCEFPDG